LDAARSTWRVYRQAIVPAEDESQPVGWGMAEPRPELELE
jgi:hypothetical protein